ncbi:MAG: hypothetical protein JRI23_30820 [Deltaproteobacteria bacterium]|jgi:hypothetical protein|nr:hypothetical protein [Deltaproteobacteria bacterium]MBW2536588.1 hypothetical protein [Deltaproteobacteria bacterium]
MGAEPGPAGPIELSAAGGALQLSFELPSGAAERPAEPLDLASAPGATADLRVAWQQAAGARVELACVRASSDRWVAGLETAVLDGASATVRKLGGLDALAPEAPTAVGPALQQDFTGRSDGAPGSAVVHGRHLLGVAGPRPDVVLCTLACFDEVPGEPNGGGDEASGTPSGPCPGVAGSFSAQGYVAAPPPGLLARAADWTMAHPRAAAAGALVLMLLAVALLLRFRPRPAY